MKNTPPQSTLELQVTDFGPIVEAKLALRPLTVFVGPSNTGKSYLAILIYSLHRCFNVDQWPDHWRRGDNWIRRDAQPQPLPRETVEALGSLAWEIATSNTASLIKQGIVLPRPVAEVIRSVFEVQGTHFSDEISRCFGIASAKNLRRRGSRGCANVVIQRTPANSAESFENRLAIGIKGTAFTTRIPSGAPLRMDCRMPEESAAHLRSMAEALTSTDRSTGNERIFDSWGFIQALTILGLRQVVSPLHLPSFYLPADRTGVMHAHSAIVNAMIEQAAMTGIRPTPHTPMLSGVTADFLQQLIALDRPVYRSFRRRKPQHDMGEQIEDAILGGSVKAYRSATTGYPYFAYHPIGWKRELALSQTSSMVSDLAPIVLFLRHVVEPGNVLIIEEPESHLHPAMHVELTRQLALLVRSGIRVIITTHSEWVLEELANIVRRSALPEAERKTSDAPAVALRPDEVGAWLFKPRSRPKGSVVEELKLDEETGLYPTDYDAVSEALYNESARLFNRIEEGNTE